ncbi:MAG: hypothetical protein JXQ71_17725 [Verrucomicrobia bacterium]|nr:hypothetical protein [Verrucomicrobiota bacterium]
MKRFALRSWINGRARSARRWSAMLVAAVLAGASVSASAQVVINELISGAVRHELHNPGSQPVPLYDPAHPTNQWRLREGVTFDFPPNILVPAGGCLLLVSFDPVADAAALAAFRAKFGVPAEVPVLGPYDGKLSDTGEGVRLLWPDKPEPSGDPGPGSCPTNG